MTDLRDLAARVMALTGPDNSLDVMCEVALHLSQGDWSIRANSAGTKVIYTHKSGHSETHWAEDWTSPERRERTAAALLARSET